MKSSSESDSKRSYCRTGKLNRCNRTKKERLKRQRLEKENEEERLR